MEFTSEAVYLLQNASDVLDEVETGLGVIRGDGEQMMALFSGTFGLMLPCALVQVKCGAIPSGGVIGVLYQHFLDLAIGSLIWYYIGFGLATGPSGSFVSTSGSGLFTEASEGRLFSSIRVVLLGVTLFSSSIVGRLRTPYYAAVIAFMSVYPFPTALHWVWSTDGWLHPSSPNRFLSGLCDVNGVATATAFAGGMMMSCIVIVGPRLLPYGVDAGSLSGRLFLSAHNKLYQGTGTLFLLICFMLINSSNMPIRAAVHSIVGTIASVGTSVLVSCILSNELYGYIDFSFALHSANSGAIVAATCAPYISLQFIPLIACFSACSYHLYRYVNTTRIFSDDPCSVISTYVIPSLWGVFGTGLFAHKNNLRELFPTLTNIPQGITHGGTGELLVSQLLGYAMCLFWGFTWCSCILTLLKMTIGLNLMDPNDGEWDVQEHGGLYCDYMRNLHKLSTGEASSEDDEKIKIFPTPRRSAMRCSVIFALVVAAAFTEGAAADAQVAAPSFNMTSIVELQERTESLAGRLADMGVDLTMMWNLVCGTIVFSMQLGFCFLEAGCVRSGSVISIIFKNFADCALGGLCWWILGYSFAYGGGSVFMGVTSTRIAFSPNLNEELSGSLGHFFLSFTYMTTAATIVSGAVAERITLQAYCAFIAVISLFAYPVVVHWVWSDSGWLSPWSPDNIISNGVLDFSGSIVIHLFGGTCALAFAYLIGPRKLPNGVSVFSEEGQVIVAPHNKFQLATGTLLLWMAWFAFNGGSVVDMANGGSKVAALAIVNTLVASAASTVVGVAATRYIYGYFELSHCCNTALVGLVSITAPCAYVSPVFAPVIGIVGVGFYFFIVYCVRRWHIDDVVDAGAVHLGGGLWGGLSVGLFADSALIRTATGKAELGNDYGLFLGGGGTQLGAQLVGILSVMAWALLITCVTAAVLKRFVGLRMSEQEEFIGIDISKHRAHSYDYIEKLEEERQRAMESVIVAQAIAEALVCFDLDTANRHLAETAQNNKNSELYFAFNSLVENLQLYRPYLPDSLFEMSPQVNEQSAFPRAIAAPGDSGMAAIVFTDIEQSTASWEECPDGMNKGLKIHNNAMREVIHEYRGYEVKTIGDAFMVAFESVVDACNFALAAHVKLYNAKWPLDLLDVAACSKNDELQWCGPRIRVGIHYGEVERELNSVTGRYDYFGGTVNRAARVEAACAGGAVAVTKSALDYTKRIGSTEPSVLDMNLQCVGAPHVISIGEVDLKGAGSTALYVLIPSQLMKRREHIETCIKLKSQKRPVAARVRGSEVSSERRSHNSESTGAEAPEFLREKLERVHASCVGCVNVTHVTGAEDVVQHVSENLSRVIACVERTEGSVVSLLSTAVLIGWNTSKKVSAFFEAALRCSSLMDHIFKKQEHNQKVLSIGLSVGPTMVGNIGTSGQRFVAVQGPCVPMAVNLCESTKMLGTTCLLASPVQSDGEVYINSLAPYCRPVDQWKVLNTVSRGFSMTTVFEVLVGKLKECSLVRIGHSDTTPDLPWSWSKPYWDAFSRREHQLIEAETTHDLIANRVVDMMQRGTSLRTTLFLGNS